MADFRQFQDAAPDLPDALPPPVPSDASLIDMLMNAGAAASANSAPSAVAERGAAFSYLRSVLISVAVLSLLMLAGWRIAVHYLSGRERVRLATIAHLTQKKKKSS